MKSRPEIFLVATVLLVPFLFYTSSSMPEACAYPPNWALSMDCSGKTTSEEGKTCCWTADEGPNKGKKVCQTCYDRTDKQGYSYTQCGPPVVSKSTLPGLETQDRLPGGGVFEIPETNDTLSGNNSSN